MLLTAIVLFVFAAAFGLAALVPILKNQTTSKPVVLIHGGLAAIALVLVLMVTATSSGPAPLTSLIIFIVAALGGFVMLAFDLQKKPIPKILAIGHPIIAAVGLIFLILFAFA